jgi:hypothetical protein
MGENNAVYGTQHSATVVLTAGASDTEVVAEPKYVSLDDASYNQVTLPDDSQYHVVTKIGWASKVGVCSFFLHGGENPTQIPVGSKIVGVANTSDFLDVHLRFPMGAPIKMSSVVAAGAELSVYVEYHTVHTQHRVPSTQDYS